jgi:hypothetical protein
MDPVSPWQVFLLKQGFSHQYPPGCRGTVRHTCLHPVTTICVRGGMPVISQHGNHIYHVPRTETIMVPGLGTLWVIDRTRA